MGRYSKALAIIHILGGFSPHAYSSEGLAILSQLIAETLKFRRLRRFLPLKFLYDGAQIAFGVALADGISTSRMPRISV
jgi:hypothetical protein